MSLTSFSAETKQPKRGRDRRGGVGTVMKTKLRATLVTLGCSLHNGRESPGGEIFRVFSRRPFSLFTFKIKGKNKF